MTDLILTLNAGSSSIKFAVFSAAADGSATATGQVDGIGVKPRLTLGDDKRDLAQVHDHASALAAITAAIEPALAQGRIRAVGHRIVHGGQHYAEPVVLKQRTIDELTGLSPLAPLHQPHNLSGIRVAQRLFPDAMQVGCFDTAFHRAQPWVNDTFALPRHFYDEGVRRYGFHGLSYEYVTSELQRIAPHHASGRLVIAHLGNGASMCAIRGGQSVASTMGFSALDGLPMGTRCGQLDPGVLIYLQRERGMSADAIEDLLYRKSGLLGLSGLSSDMRALEAAGTPEAQQAIDYFVFRIRRELGAMTAILSGLDALAFAGGIGENAWRVRERICQGFEWLGIELDETRNRLGEGVISSDRSRVRVFIVKTSEETMIARHVRRLMAAQTAGKP
ncbi:MAG: acetate/propionate family kinase [Hyphomicrobiaceae bacterium]|mgnify:CR=1 FL=1